MYGSVCEVEHVKVNASSSSNSHSHSLASTTERIDTLITILQEIYNREVAFVACAI